LKVFVINLAESTDRREACATELDKFDVEYEFFPACRGDQGHEPFFDDYDQQSYLISTRRLASAAEIGCYASHLMLWRKCVELNQPIVILEDDFKLQPNFSAALSASEKFADELGFIRLHPLVIRPKPNSRRLDKRVKIAEVDGFRLSYLGKVPTCMLSYVVNPKAAAAFIAASHTLTAPVDKFMQQVWMHKQPIFALGPPCVMEGITASASTIGDRSIKQKLGIELKFTRQLGRLVAIAKRYRFRRQHLQQILSLGKQRQKELTVNQNRSI